MNFFLRNKFLSMLIYIIVINSLNAAITIISQMLFYIEPSRH